MPNSCCRNPYQTLKKAAIFCLTWSLLSISTATSGESNDEAPVSSDNPAQVVGPDSGLTDSEQDSGDEEAIVVELDIPPELAAFLDEQEASAQGVAPAAKLEDNDASSPSNTGLATPPPDGSFGVDIEAETSSLANSEPAPQEAAPAIAFNNPVQDPLENLPYRGCFAEAAKTHEVEEFLLIGIAIVESSLDPDAVSGSDALGLMQIKWPITAKHLGIEDRQALFDPCTNIDAGARYLRELLDDLGSFAPQPRMRLALASYRLGPNGFDPNVPLPETAQDYIERVQAQRTKLVSPADNAAMASVSGPVLPCLVQNLRQLTAITHDPNQRNAQFGGWLDARGQGCSTLALIQIRNNMPTWLGTSLTPELEAQVRNLLTSSIDEPEREAPRQNTELP
jgi:soluble lytic murein transglycosylase-like protein